MTRPDAAHARIGGYSPLARTLHWTVALLVPAQIALGWIAEYGDTADGGMRVLGWHYRLGMLLVLVMLLRVHTRLARGMPEPLPGTSRWRRHVAHALHAVLYLLLFLLPASGYVIWVWMGAPMDVLGVEVPRLFEPPGDDERGRAIAWYVHIYAAWLLAALTGLHVAAALWHAVIRRDGVLRRMW